MKTSKVMMVVTVCALSACSPKYYSANSQNVPLISHQGETNLTLSGSPNQVEFEGAYGVGKNMAVIANGGFFIPADEDNGNGGSGKLIELGAGYFKEVRPHWIFESYGLVGFGSMENHLPSTTGSNPQTKGDISANILRLGVQPNFGYKSKYFSAAVSSRFVNLSYNNIKGDLIYNGESQTDYLQKNSSNFLIEPALTLRGGLEKLKFQLQFGYSFNLSNSNFRQDESFVTFGFNFHIN